MPCLARQRGQSSPGPPLAKIAADALVKAGIARQVQAVNALRVSMVAMVLVGVEVAVEAGVLVAVEGEVAATAAVVVAVAVEVAAVVVAVVAVAVVAVGAGHGADLPAERRLAPARPSDEQ